MKINDEAKQGYCLVNWITKLYTVQENTVIKEVDPPQIVFAEEIIFNAILESSL